MKEWGLGRSEGEGQEVRPASQPASSRFSAVYLLQPVSWMPLGTFSEPMTHWECVGIPRSTLGFGVGSGTVPEVLK